MTYETPSSPTVILVSRAPGWGTLGILIVLGDGLKAGWELLL